MLKSKRVTIKEVAEAAGVSTQTVSRVLNDRPDVAPDTRIRVQEIIDALSFRPSALARSLIQQRSYTLGLVTAGLKFIGPSRALSGIAGQAEQMGYTILLKELPRFDACDIQPILNSLLSRQVDGLIWAVPEVGDNRCWLEERLAGLPVPILFLTMEARSGLNCVAVDNAAGGRLATQHLLDQSRSHIGHLSGPLDWWEARQRKAGWQETLLATGKTILPTHWAEGNWSSSSGEAAMRQLLDTYPEMDAVFVANDQMAIGVLQAAYKRGRRVPQDLAVVGFDDLPESAYLWPALTTIHHDLFELGCTAVRELVKMIEASHTNAKELEPRSILLQPRLVVRESSKGHIP